MQAQGYVRFRVNGTVFEHDDLPTLKKTEKHDIDVVIDRIKVRAAPVQLPNDHAANLATRTDYDNLKQRLAESFEAALRLANGRAIALEMDSPRSIAPKMIAPHAYQTRRNSAQRALIQCQVCLPGVQPLDLGAGTAPVLLQLTSGRLPQCDGLGQQEFFDPARVVAFPSLSLASGAIKGWDRRNGYYFSMLESLAKHYQFDIDAPFESLPEPQCATPFLQGSGEEEIKFSYVMDSGASAGQEAGQKTPL
jgi:excinuclease ABC subunit A